MLYQLSYEDLYTGSRGTSQLLKLRFNYDGHIFILFVFPQFTSFHSVFHSFHGLMNSINCWFASDVTAAMLVVKTKRVSLRWEMNSILMQILQKNFFCIDHQHGRLVTWLQTKNWPAPSVWVFIGQLVEHCRANTEAMGLNRVEATEKLFSG